MCTAKLKIKDSKAVKYEIAKQKRDGSKIKLMDAILVDAGVMAFIDAQVCEECREFLLSLYNKNNDINIYDDYFFNLFKKSYEKYPEIQRTDGDFFEWKNPNTNNSLVMISTGFGDGIYNCFWGYDQDGDICELVVPFINPDLIENESNKYDINDAHYGGFIVSKNVSAGKKIKYTFRKHSNINALNGWTIYSDEDDDEYVNNADNFEILSATSIKKINPEMLKLFEAPYGTDLCWLYDKKGNFMGFYDLITNKEVTIDEVLNKK